MQIYREKFSKKCAELPWIGPFLQIAALSRTTRIFLIFQSWA